MINLPFNSLIRLTLPVLLFIGLGACRSDNSRFELKNARHTGIDFANHLASNDSINLLNFEYFYNGGGVAVGDLNNDGLPDIYFTGNMVSSKLYLNQGELAFSDITEQAGVQTEHWATGVAMVDINHDSWLDIYVCRSGYLDPQLRKNLLFINQGLNPQGVPTFVEQAEQYGLADSGYSTQAVFLDYDRDGDLDLYLASVNRSGSNPNVIASRPKPNRDSSIDRLYRNNGDNTFTNVSEAAGISHEGYGLGVVVGDLNQDGWPDIYVGNDFLYNDLVYLNNQDGTFTESNRQLVKHTSHFSMGTDIADFNNDGLPDIITMDMMPDDSRRQKLMNGVKNYDEFQLAIKRGYTHQYVRNNLQLNNGNGTFSEISQLAGVHYTDWSWSPLLADFDNDGHRDLFITNGIRKDITHLDFATYYVAQMQSRFSNEGKDEHLLKMAETLEGAKKPNVLFRNNGDLTFSNESESWGLQQPAYSNGAAYADLDNDGDLDLVINNVDEVAFIYQNKTVELAAKSKDEAAANNYLRLKLIGPAQNPGGIGAKVRILYGEQQQVAEHYPFRGFQSTVDQILHFGLGQVARLEVVEVVWPDGKREHLRGVEPNQLLTLAYQNAREVAPAVPTAAPEPLFASVAKEMGIAFRHAENGFVDFKVQPLLPHKYSQSGPGLAVGDVNGDGLDDFYVGGSSTQTATLFIQRPDGTFGSRPFQPLAKPEEDTGCLFFDADGDGDLDLYVVSGGSEHKYDSPAAYQDRLYRNDGKGTFTLDREALPTVAASGSCVVAADYDGDGDLDVFVGGRMQPGRFPLPAQSYILRNDNGRFTDVTAQLCPELQELGMVTSALWTDFDNDGQVDLLVAGEWMPLTFFKNGNGKLTDVTVQTGLSGTTGWWNSLVAGDFDNDGDTDYVIGNLGLNSRFKASPEEPLLVHAKDFDNNTSIDAIMSQTYGGVRYPVHSRDELTDQMVSMRREFRSYDSYASKTFDELFPAERLQDTYQAKTERLASSYLENLGQGRFQLTALPMRAQVAPVNGMLAGDYDGDGHLDLLLTGNSYATEVMVGRYDAFIGLFLKGDGAGGFLPQSVARTGFFIDTDAKALARVRHSSGRQLLLASSNNDSLKVFALANRGSEAVAQSHAVPLQPLDFYAELTWETGRKQKQELHHGSGYLSQSSRTLWVPAGVSAVRLVDYRGRSRQVSLPVAGGVIAAKK